MNWGLPHFPIYFLYFRKIFGFKKLNIWIQKIVPTQNYLFSWGVIMMGGEGRCVPLLWYTMLPTIPWEETPTKDETPRSLKSKYHGSTHIIFCLLYRSRGLKNIGSRNGHLNQRPPRARTAKHSKAQHSKALINERKEKNKRAKFLRENGNLHKVLDGL